MIPSTVFGLPLHPLVVHATVVVVPTAALAVLLSALWPRFRDWAGYLPVILAASSVVLVPLSTSSGENLEHSIPHSQLIEEHAHLADQMLPFVIALLVVSVAQWWLRRGVQAQWMITAVAVIAVLASVGTAVEIARIGHSGAKAAWSDTVDSGSGT